MNTEEAKIELNRRLNILNEQKIPKITKRDLRKGMSNLNQRKEIGRYSKNINQQKRNCLNLLNEIENPPVKIGIMSEGSSEPETEYILGVFNNPQIKNTRKRTGRGYFWD
jgi:hypothetical protein